jgi:hypothetical protein
VSKLFTGARRDQSFRIQENVDSLFFYFVLLILRELANTYKGAERCKRPGKTGEGNAILLLPASSDSRLVRYTLPLENSLLSYPTDAIDKHFAAHRFRLE